MPPPIRNRDINRSLERLVFARYLKDIGFDFEPSIGIIAKALDKLGMDIRSFREPLTQSIRQVMMPSIRKNFDAGGRPETWEELAPYTVMKRGSTGPILIRSGRLRKVASSFSIWHITTTAASVQSLPSKAWYGHLHQAGYGGFARFVHAAKSELGPTARPSEITRRSYELMDAEGAGPKGQAKMELPQRQFVLFQEEDIDDIQEVFFDWMSARADVFMRSF
jgi:phage gpG-like protein